MSALMMIKIEDKRVIRKHGKLQSVIAFRIFSTNYIVEMYVDRSVCSLGEIIVGKIYEMFVENNRIRSLVPVVEPIS